MSQTSNTVRIYNQATNQITEIPVSELTDEMACVLINDCEIWQRIDEFDYDTASRYEALAKIL